MPELFYTSVTLYLFFHARFPSSYLGAASLKQPLLNAYSVCVSAETGSSQSLLIGTYSAVALSCVHEFSAPFLQEMTWNYLHFSKLQDQKR